MEATGPAAELSSMRTALDDLTRRVTAIAEGFSGPQNDNVVQDLFQVERLLKDAVRRLEKLGRSLGKD